MRGVVVEVCSVHLRDCVHACGDVISLYFVSFFQKYITFKLGVRMMIRFHC